MLLQLAAEVLSHFFALPSNGKAHPTRTARRVERLVSICGCSLSEEPGRQLPDDQWRPSSGCCADR